MGLFAGAGTPLRTEGVDQAVDLGQVPEPFVHVVLRLSSRAARPYIHRGPRSSVAVLRSLS